ncbi:MAG: zinc-binding dehydrogenase [Peptoniphilus sp.]|nr:zinc-binding dehydrogenase [Peptoniphilus sp.]MDD7362853.1 zinc-binding dehydrogenase [Bacillota bacterium]MDY6043955.1 zinc-binding dehydrogenase [Peptoniphilus sp.]
MKAVVFKEFGSSDVLEFVERPIPLPAEDEVLVRVDAVTVDNVDIIIRKGLYPTELQNPAITGRDLVGAVESVGKSVKNFLPGDAVWTNSAGFDGRMGATAEYVAVRADRLYRIPESVDPHRLVASVHSSSTAQIVTREMMKLREGDTILIEGAGGNVGRKFVQCAHALKARVFTTSSEKSFDALYALGADRCFSYDTSGMEELSSIRDDVAIRHIIDTSGKVTLSQNLSLLGFGGQLTLITPPPADTSFDASAFYMNDQCIRGFVLSHATCAQLEDNAQHLNRYFEQGLLLEDPVEFHSLEDVPELHAQLEKEGAHGMKYVILTEANLF